MQFRPRRIYLTHYSEVGDCARLANDMVDAVDEFVTIARAAGPHDMARMRFDLRDCGARMRCANTAARMSEAADRRRSSARISSSTPPGSSPGSTARLTRMLYLALKALHIVERGAVPRQHHHRRVLESACRSHRRSARAGAGARRHHQAATAGSRCPACCSSSPPASRWRCIAHLPAAAHALDRCVAGAVRRLGPGVRFAVGPLQKKLLANVRAGLAGNWDETEYHALSRSWGIWGIVATAAPLIARCS